MSAAMNYANTAVVSWDDLKQIRVYATDATGQIVEWQWFGSGQWGGPGRIGAKADPSKPITATTSNGRLRVYYFGTDGRLREHVYDNAWVPGATLPLPQ